MVRRLLFPCFPPWSLNLKFQRRRSTTHHPHVRPIGPAAHPTLPTQRVRVVAVVGPSGPRLLPDIIPQRNVPSLWDLLPR